MTRENKREGAANRTCPASAEELQAAIIARYDSLSPRLQQVAQYLLDHPNEMAVETIAVIAERSQVQPSTLIRFAKEFGYAGASEMQRLFRDKLLDGRAALSYQERVRSARETSKQERKESLLQILSDITQQNIVALEHLHDGITERDMRRVAELIDRAETVYVTARRRSFPIASFIAYTLLRFGKNTILVDGVGGLETLQSEVIGKRDLLITISYKPYAPETVQFAARAAERKCKTITITDSRFSPLAPTSDVVLIVNEAEVSGFRSLTSTSTLAQALLLGYAFHRQRKHSDDPMDSP